MCVSLQEIFGPVLSVYVYPENDYKNILQLIDSTSPYALTGAVFAQDEYEYFFYSSLKTNKPVTSDLLTSCFLVLQTGSGGGRARVEERRGELLRERQIHRLHRRSAAVRWRQSVRYASLVLVAAVTRVLTTSLTFDP